MLDLHRYSPTLALDAEGIWTTGASAEVSYPAEDHDACLVAAGRELAFGGSLLVVARRHA
jgi:hypothetical protein